MPNMGLFEGVGAETERPLSSAKPLTGVPGLSYLRSLMTRQDEAQLLTFIDSQPWRSDLKRRVQHYGFIYDYRARRVSMDDFLGPLPRPLHVLAEGLMSEGLFKRTPDQVIVNEYLPGQGIAPHVDCQPCFGDTIASLSLGSTCLMDFTQQELELKETVCLEAGSLLVLQGAARHFWRHSIAPRKSDRIDGTRHQRSRRVSLTFRTVNN